MDFEWDQTKSESNEAKHGINFPSASRLWDGPVLSLPSNQPGELRHLSIGKIGEDYWTAITTRRGSAIRLISVRASRDNEKHIYDESLEEKEDRRSQS